MPNFNPFIALSICLGIATAVVLLIEFSNLTSVNPDIPLFLISSPFIINISDTSTRLCLITPFSSFSELPNTLLIQSTSLLAFACTTSLYFLARRVLILPLSELPGIIGLLVLMSLITGESTAPIAENADEPPICIPVFTSKTPLI